jgi:hypothetical protein
MLVCWSHITFDDGARTGGTVDGERAKCEIIDTTLEIDLATINN